MIIIVIEPNKVLEKYADMVYQLALVQMKNKQDAEDIFQEVFLRLVNTKPDIHSEKHMKAWLIRVTINCCKSQWRTFWRKKVVSLTDNTLLYDHQENHLDVYEAVLKLPKMERVVIDLFYYEDMSLDEISKALHISYQAAAQRLSRARKKLKHSLTDDKEERDGKLSQSI